MPDENANESRTQRAARTLKASTGTERAWGVWQGVLVAAICAVALGFVGMRDDVIFSKAFATQVAPQVHADHAGRLKYLERPEALLQLAQATGALSKVEAAADLAQGNAAAIGVIQNDLQHVKNGGDRRERLLERALAKLDELNVKRAPGH